MCCNDAGAAAPRPRNRRRNDAYFAVSYFLIMSFADCSRALPSYPFAVMSRTHSSSRFAVAFSQFASSEAGMT